MTSLEDFLTKYVAVWNEPDSDVRRRWIADTWSERASLFNRVKEYHGRSGVADAVQRSYGLFVSRGFTFRPRGSAASHHKAVRFTWEMITPDGEVDSVGTQFLVLDDAGRIELDYQFIEDVAGFTR